MLEAPVFFFFNFLFFGGPPVLLLRNCNYPRSQETEEAQLHAMYVPEWDLGHKGKEILGGQPVH